MNQSSYYSSLKVLLNFLNTVSILRSSLGALHSHCSLEVIPDWTFLCSTIEILPKIFLVWAVSHVSTPPPLPVSSANPLVSPSQEVTPWLMDARLSQDPQTMEHAPLRGFAPLYRGNVP